MNTTDRCRPNLTLASWWGDDWVRWEVHVGAGVQFIGCDCATIGLRSSSSNIMVDGYQAEYENDWLRLSPAPNPISVGVALQSLAAAKAADQPDCGCV